MKEKKYAVGALTSVCFILALAGLLLSLGGQARVSAKKDSIKAAHSLSQEAPDTSVKPEASLTQLVLALSLTPALSTVLAVSYNEIANDSGQAQPIMDGITGQPISIGSHLWVIAPGETLLSHEWEGSPRFVFNGVTYHYIGSVGSPFRSFIVPDWGTAEAPPTGSSGTPTPYTPIVNDSAQPQPVIDGGTGQPIFIGSQPWTIAPGETILSHQWQGNPRFVFSGATYHYIGSVGGSTFRFFLVPEWQDNSAVPPSTLTGIQISFRLDPWLVTGTYSGELWVSPPVFGPVTQGGSTFAVQTRAHGLDAQENSVGISPEWTSADPEMVTVTPSQGNEVKITVHRAGQSSLQVTSQGVSKELFIKAAYQGSAIQVEIAQDP